MTTPIEPTEAEIEAALLEFARHGGRPRSVFSYTTHNRMRAALRAARQVSPQKTYADGIEDAAKVAEEWLSTSHILLHAGEMTRQELRSVRAVVGTMADAIRALGKEGS